MLLPYRSAMAMRRGSTTRADDLILLVALILMIALGANSYFATSAFVGGQAHPTADGVTVAVITTLQWLVVKMAALLQWLIRRVWNG